MSAESASLSAPEAASGLNLRTVQVLRYALGSAVAITVALGVGWKLSVLTPVLGLSFLGTAAPRPTLRQGIGFVVVVTLACLAAYLLSVWLLPYPAVFVPAMALVLFRIFAAQESGAPPLMIVWSLVAFTVLPLVAAGSPALAVAIAEGLVFGAGVTVALVLLAYGFLPDPPDAVLASPEVGAPETPPEERLVNAALSTVVVFPIFLVFHLFELSGSLVVLIFIALLSQQPSFAANFKAGKAMLMGNAMGGVAAVVVYELLVIAPELAILFLLTLLFGLYFGSRLFSDRPTAPLYGMAFSTLLLVVGMSAGMEDDAGGKVLTRVVQIFLAVLYVVVAFGLIECFRKRRHA